MDQQPIGHSDLSEFVNDTVSLSRQEAGKYRDQVHTLRDKLRQHINEHPDYSLIKMLLSGSLKKGTALSTLNDIDVAVYVKSADAPEDSDNLIPWLKDRLIEAYGGLMSSDQFNVQKHSVGITFSGSGLDVDAVPVLYQGDEDDRGYIITRDMGKKVLTSIPLHIDFIRSRKDDSNRHFAQVIRLIKWWKRKQEREVANFELKSFLVELICAHLKDKDSPFSKAVDGPDYFQAVAAFFAYVVSSGLSERIAFTDYYSSNELPSETQEPVEIFDPVNPDNNVAEQYSELTRRSIVEASQGALNAFDEAEFSTTKGRALDRLREEVFGPSFGR